MKVFEGRSKITRAIPDPRLDQTLPHQRSLSWGGITGPQGLSRTTGADCELVHGTHWYEVSGTLTEQIAVDQASLVDRHETHEIGVDQTVLVGGNHKETVRALCQQSILGPHIVFNLSVRNETRLGASTETHGDFETANTSAGKTITGADHHESYGSAYQRHGTDIQLFGLSFSLIGMQLSVTGASLSVKAFLDYVLTLMHVELTILHYELHLSHKEDHDAA